MADNLLCCCSMPSQLVINPTADNNTTIILNTYGPF